MTPEPILFADHAPALGGAERSLLLLLKHLDRRRWQPNVVGVAGPLLEEASRLGVRTCATSLPRLRKSARFPLDLLRGVRELAQMAQRVSASLIVANTVRAAIYAAPAAKWAKIPLIWHMRDFWLSEDRPRYPSVDRFGKQFLTAAAAAVIANSGAVAHHLPASTKVRVVRNGIEVASFQGLTDGRRFRDAHHIPQTAPLVGMIGRLRPWKGQLTFLDVAHAVLEVAPYTRFVIVGGDPFGVEDDFSSSVEARTKALGLQDSVTFTGHISDVRPALAAMDLFVHPGEPEPFGLVNVEAMAAGLPVVAFAHGALPEIVQDGVTGRLVVPGAHGALTGAILELLADAPLRDAMGKAAHERAATEFSIERTVAEVDAIYRAVVGYKQ